MVVAFNCIFQVRIVLSLFLSNVCFFSFFFVLSFLSLISKITDVVGLPSFATFIIVRAKRETLIESKSFKMRWGLLYLGYREGRAWWELVIACRKVFIVAIGTFGALFGATDLQAYLALLVVFFSIVAHLVGQPFDVRVKHMRLLHRLEFFALTVCFCTFCKFSRGIHS